MSGNGQITVELSPGEVADRVQILRLKAVRVSSTADRLLCLDQAKRLQAGVRLFEQSCGYSEDAVLSSDEAGELFSIHSELWDLENLARVMVREQATDLLRIVKRIQELNAARARIKAAITQRFGKAADQEIKQYAS